MAIYEWVARTGVEIGPIAISRSDNRWGIGPLTLITNWSGQMNESHLSFAFSILSHNQAN